MYISSIVVRRIDHRTAPGERERVGKFHRGIIASSKLSRYRGFPHEMSNTNAFRISAARRHQQQVGKLNINSALQTRRRTQWQAGHQQQRDSNMPRINSLPEPARGAMTRLDNNGDANQRCQSSTAGQGSTRSSIIAASDIHSAASCRTGPLQLA